jgi:hypothetical protein
MEIFIALKKKLPCSYAVCSSAQYIEYFIKLQWYDYENNQRDELCKSNDYF